VHYQRSDLETAERQLRAGLHQMPSWVNLQDVARGSICLALLLNARGDFNGAIQILESAEGAASEAKQHLAAKWMAASQVRLQLIQGNLDAATAWQPSVGLEAEKPELPIPYPRELEYRVFVRVLIANKKSQTALSLLERLKHAAETSGRVLDLLEAQVLEVLAYQKHGDTNKAIQVLVAALNLAEAEGIVRVFLDEGTPITMLLEQIIEAQHRGTPPASSRVSLEFLHKLLAATTASSILNSSEAGVFDALSERESTVLRLIAQGLSNKAIAKELGLETGTVKWYVNTIYSKLEVHSRTQAIARAGQLGLLSTAP
jgi:LuxR family transcriptional regulator, maltose regulon positive regulatory protein